MIEIPTEVGASLLRLAKREIRAALGELDPGGDAACPGHELLRKPAGCFVSLHSRHGHALRGCIGRMEADVPLMELVGCMARSVLGDPRFADHPVTVDELPDLEIELSIVSPPRALNGPDGFDLWNDGIALTLEERRGCFLPQVARETGWTRRQLLERLCTEKMGLPAHAWRDPQARFEAFATTCIGPEAF